MIKLLIPIILGLLSCKLPKGAWENIDSDYEPQLNVLALISLDEEEQSFVGVRRTLTLDEKEGEYVRGDTVWQSDGTYSFTQYLISTYPVRDAMVEIIEGTKSYSFTFMSSKSSTEQYDLHKYYDTTGTFIPKENTLYKLTVTTNKWGTLTGEVVTPSIPKIDSASVPDTIFVKKPYSVTYDLGGDVYGKIATYMSENPNWVCGTNINAIVQPGSNKWTTPPNDCVDDRYKNAESGKLTIRLRVMDNQYYEYMYRIKGNDFVDFLTGGGSRGYTIGVKGGIGVFGAIAADKIERIIVP